MFNNNILDVGDIPVLKRQEVEKASSDRIASFKRHCSHCSLPITSLTSFLVWQNMDFCNAECLEGYVNAKADKCDPCQETITYEDSVFYAFNASLNLNYFCGEKCLNSFKENVKFCSCCQQKMCSDEILTFTFSVNTKLDFCTKKCAEYYQQNYFRESQVVSCIEQCNYCKELTTKKFKLLLNGQVYIFCSAMCLFVTKTACKLHAGEFKISV